MQMDSAAMRKILSYALCTTLVPAMLVGCDSSTELVSGGTSAEVSGSAHSSSTTGGTSTETSSEGGGTDTGETTASPTDTVAPSVPMSRNHAPSFSGGADHTARAVDGPQSIPGWASGMDDSDADVEQSLEFQVITNSNPELFDEQPRISYPSGTLRYTAKRSGSGAATIVVVLKDDGGTDNGGVDTSLPVTFQINIAAAPSNKAPTFTAGGNHTSSAGAALQEVSGWASDIDDGNPEYEQGLRFEVSSSNSDLFEVQPSVSYPSGTLRYKTKPRITGSAIITVLLKDDGGTLNGEDSSHVVTAVILITEAPASNTPPTAETVTTETLQSIPVEIPALVNDFDGDPMTIEVSTQPAHGSVSVSGLTFTYTPNLGYIGPDSFSYVASDGHALSSPATVEISIKEKPTSNSPPTVESITATTTQDTVLDINALVNDPDGDPLTITITEPPIHGSASVSGLTFQYAPESGYTGLDSFSYTASDGSSSSAIANVDIEVIAVTEPSFDTVDHTWHIDNDRAINAAPGTEKMFQIISFSGDVEIKEIRLVGAPDWISIANGELLSLNPPVSQLGGVTHEFEIIVSAEDSNGKIHELSFSTSSYTQTSTVILEGNLPLEGGELSTDWRDVVIRSDGGLENQYAIKYTLVEKADGRHSFRLSSVPNISEADAQKIEIETAELSELYSNYKTRSTGLSRMIRIVGPTNRAKVSTGAGGSNYSVSEECKRVEYKDDNGDGFTWDKIWWGVSGWYVDNASFELDILDDGGEPRILPVKEYDYAYSWSSFWDGLELDKMCAATLQSNYSSKADLHDKEPVLFVHGFNSAGSLSGGDDYWSKFPAMVDELEIEERRFFPLTYRWQTNVRMEVAAEELETAIRLVYAKTRKKVHIVAHSFGGVLTRTLMQGHTQLDISVPKKDTLERIIASVTSVGSPYLGVFSETETVEIDGESRIFHRGFGNNFTGRVARWCSAIPCHQQGQPYDPRVFGIDTGIPIIGEDAESNLAEGIGMNNLVAGDLTFKLASGYPSEYPEISTQQLLGSYHDRVGSSSYINIRPHDLLISSYGQLWTPGLEPGSHRSLESGIGGKQVNEHFLGNNRTVNFTYGMFDDEFSHENVLAVEISGTAKGYAHMTGSANKDNYSEVGLETCDPENESACDHATWHYFKDIVSKNSQSGEVAIEPQTITLTGKVEYYESQQTRSALPLIGKQVSLIFSNGEGRTGYTSQTGEFQVEVEFKPNSVLKIVIDPNQSDSGEVDTNLRSEVREVVTYDTVEETSVDLGTIVLYPHDLISGGLTIAVNDSSNASQLNGFRYEVVSSAGVRVAVGDSLNLYSVTLDLPYDKYNLSINKDGYEGVEEYVCDHNEAQTGCTPTVDPTGYVAEGGMSAVLTWGQNPRDLDSHLIRYNSSGAVNYHIYFSNKTAGNDSLDVDDTSSFGPETVRVNSLDVNSKYVYAVRHYSGTGSITSTSTAQVKVSIDGSSERVFTPPTSVPSTSSQYWKVFEVSGGRLYPCNSNCIVNSIDDLSPIQRASRQAIQEVVVWHEVIRRDTASNPK